MPPGRTYDAEVGKCDAGRVAADVGPLALIGVPGQQMEWGCVREAGGGGDGPIQNSQSRLLPLSDDAPASLLLHSRGFDAEVES
jgi:hypothetical protein